MSIKRWGISAVIVVMIAVGAAAWWKTYDIRSAQPNQNQAVVDSSADGTVRSAVSKALTQVFSYDFDNPDATREAADRYLRGVARDEYDTLFTTLEEKAPDQKLTLSAQVETIALKTLSDNEAEALVFLDQTSQRAKDSEASASAAQLAITAQNRDGHWQITKLTTL